MKSILFRSILLPLVLAGALVPAACRSASPAGGGGEGAGARDAFLDNLVGDWEVIREHDGEISRHALRAEWILNRQFLKLHMRHQAEPPEYEAIVLIGYDGESKEYVAHWCDIFGAKFSAVGRGARTGDSVEFVFEYLDGPFYNTFTWDAEAKGWAFIGEAKGEDGRRVPFAVDTVKRR